MTKLRPGAVIFTHNHRRLGKFYDVVTGLAVELEDDQIVVLGSATFELVIHSLPNEPVITERPRVREDAYIKPFFPVKSLAEARENAAGVGGRLSPVDKEWAGRGFRACEAVDPDGNVIQFREDVELH